jgi:hypothetical protein
VAKLRIERRRLPNIGFLHGEAFAIPAGRAIGGSGLRIGVGRSRFDFTARQSRPRKGLANQALGADRFRGFLKRKIRDWMAPMERFIF